MKAKRTWVRVSVALVALATSAIVAAAAWMAQCETRADPSPSPAMDAREDADGFPHVDWEHWKKVNPDIIGWVTVPGTRIDQPIVQAKGSDPDYYLHHDIYKKYNPMGVPYLDAGCKRGLDSENAVVFGHHWAQGKVFSAFAKYSDEAFAERHRKVLLQTPEWKRALEVQAVEVTNGGTPTKVVDFESHEEFECWYQERYDACRVKLAPDPIGDDCPGSIATFCTCSYAHANDRTLVYAAESNS